MYLWFNSLVTLNTNLASKATLTVKTLQVRGLGYNFYFISDSYGILVNATVVNNNTTPRVRAVNRQSSGIYAIIFDRNIGTSEILSIECTWLK